MRAQKDAFTRSILTGLKVLPGTRAVGRCVLHPWQAAVAARVMAMMDDVPEMMLADLHEDVHLPVGRTAHVVVKVLARQHAVVLNAATGTGKTFVASVLALQRTVYCVAHPNSCRQWCREAAKVGIDATWVDSVHTLKRCVSNLDARPLGVWFVRGAMQYAEARAFVSSY